MAGPVAAALLGLLACAGCGDAPTPAVEKAAEKMATAASEDDPWADVVAEARVTLHEKNDPATAITMLEQVLSDNPSHYAAQYRYALALEAAGRNDEAIKAWRTFLDSATRSQDAQWAEEAQEHLMELDPLMTAGLAALEEGDAEAAAEHFEQLLAENPDHYGAKYQLAVALEAAGRRSEAVTAWWRFLNAAKWTGDDEWALEARERLAQLDPVMTPGFLALHDEGDPARAVGLFQTVLDQQPDHYGAKYQLALALQMSGERQKSITAWREFIAAADEIGDTSRADEARERVKLLEAE